MSLPMEKTASKLWTNGCTKRRAVLSLPFVSHVKVGWTSHVQHHGFLLVPFTGLRVRQREGEKFSQKTGNPKHVSVCVSLHSCCFPLLAVSSVETKASGSP